MISRDRISIRINMYINSEKINFVLNWFNIINVFFILNIGLNIRKVIIVLLLNVFWNDEVMKVLVEEYNDKI